MRNGVRSKTKRSRLKRSELKPTAKIDRTLLPVRKKREKFGVARSKKLLYLQRTLAAASERSPPNEASLQLLLAASRRRRVLDWKVRAGQHFFLSCLLLSHHRCKVQ